MALYGYESTQVCVIVVSFMGSVWMMHCPVFLAQSINRRKSRRSPVPKLLSERSENTGITEPAPRHKGCTSR